MNDLKLDGLTGKTIKEAEVDGFGIRMVFTDGAVFDYDASDGGYSQYELTEATADAMQKQIDHIADSGRKVSISCGRENDLISRQMAIDTIMGQPPEPHYPSWYAAQIEKLPAVQPETNCSEIPNGSDDTISRQAAIDALDKRFDSIPMEQTTEILLLRKDLRDLQSVQPERLTDDDFATIRIHLNAYKEELCN